VLVLEQMTGHIAVKKSILHMHWYNYNDVDRLMLVRALDVEMGARLTPKMMSDD
jgi:hypothetical protein